VEQRLSAAGYEVVEGEDGEEDHAPRPSGVENVHIKVMMCVVAFLFFRLLPGIR
jgi:hypothetical protein